MMDILNIMLSESFWAASLRIATPLIFGVLGALLCERSGVLNLGIEGIFVVGAICGWMAVWLGSGLWGGVLTTKPKRLGTSEECPRLVIVFYCPEIVDSHHETVDALHHRKP